MTIQKLNFRPDPDAEFVLKEIVGVTWETEEVRLDEIDWKESANNCARLSAPLVQHLIEDYHASFARGDVFPMVVMEISENGYIILGGNQRCNAAKMFDDITLVVGAYIVDPLTSADRELIIRSLNSRHGQGASKDERLEHAVFLVQGKGISTEVAAHAMCVGASTILHRIRANETRSALTRKGVDCSTFSLGHLDTLGRVANEARKTQLAKSVELYKPTAEQLSGVVAGVAKAKSEAAAQKLVVVASKEWADSLSVKKTVSRSTSRRKVKFIDTLRRMSLFLETGNGGGAISTLDDAGCNPNNDGDTVRVLAAKITNRLNCILESGK